MLIPTLRRSLLVALPTALSALLAVACGGNAEGSNVSGSGDGSQGSNTGSGAQPMLGNPNNPNGGGGNGSGGVMTIDRGSECA